MEELSDHHQGQAVPSPREVHNQLQAILNGDDSAAAWLYRSFAPGLLRRLRGRYGFPGGLDAEDLLQDAFVFYLQRNGKVLADFMQRVPAARQTAICLERHLWDLACGLATNRRRSASRVTLLSLFDTPRRSNDAGVEHRTIERDLLQHLDSCLERRSARIYL